MADERESDGEHATPVTAPAAAASDTAARWAEEQLFELCKGEEPAELSRYHNLLLVPYCQVSNDRPTHSVTAPSLRLASAARPLVLTCALIPTCRPTPIYGAFCVRQITLSQNKCPNSS